MKTNHPKYVIRSNDELEGYDLVQVGALIEDNQTTGDIVVATVYDIDKVDAIIDAFKAEDERAYEEALNAQLLTGEDDFPSEELTEMPVG